MTAIQSLPGGGHLTIAFNSMMRRKKSPKQGTLLDDSSDSSIELFDTSDNTSLASEHGSKHSLNSSGGSLNSSWSSLSNTGSKLMKPIEKVKQFLPRTPMKMTSVLPKNYAELMEDYSSEDLSGALDRVTAELPIDADASMNDSFSALDHDSDQGMIAQAFRDDNITLNDSSAKLHDSFDSSLWSLRGECILLDPPSDPEGDVQAIVSPLKEDTTVSPPPQTTTKKRTKKYSRRKKQPVSEQPAMISPKRTTRQRSNPRRGAPSRLTPTRRNGRMVNKKITAATSPASNLKILQESIRKISLENNQHMHGGDESHFYFESPLSMRSPRRKIQRRPATLALDHRSTSISDSEDLGRIAASPTLNRDRGAMDLKPQRERVKFDFNLKDLKTMTSKSAQSSCPSKARKHDKAKITMPPMVATATIGLDALPGV